MLKLVVLSCVLAAATASVVPIAYGAGLGYGAPYTYGASWLNPYGINYRGPLSLAPGQPANILAADGRPLDTLEVNLDRSAHLVSKAYNSGVHLLKKRSVAPWIAPIAPIAPIASRLAYPAPLIAHASPLAYGRITNYGYPYSSFW